MLQNVAARYLPNAPRSEAWARASAQAADVRRMAAAVWGVGRLGNVLFLTAPFSYYLEVCVRAVW